MNQQWAKRGENFLGFVKYCIALILMLAGVVTAFGPLRPMHGDLGFIYNSRLALVLFGIWFFASGATLLYGKIRKRRKPTGLGLLLIFNCFLFSCILNSIAASFFDWGNALSAAVVGALYLRWRFKTSYINPNHFIDDVETLER